MKVALVLPPAERIAEKKDIPAYQHVGLGYLAAMLEKQGIDVLVIDAKLQRLSLSQVLEAIKEAKPDILGITAMTHEINMAGNLAKNIKESGQDIFTVIGGVHTTALPAQTLNQYSWLDLGIIGEGEYSFLDVIRKIEKDDFDFSSLSGVVYRNGKDILLSKPRQQITNLDDLPLPAWHRFPKASEYILITARGCPFSCLFCMQALGHNVRKRSVDNVVKEIESVFSTRPPRRLRFYDETFTLDKARVHELCGQLKKKGLNKRIKWSVTTRVDSVDKELLKNMKEAGCDEIEFGVESGDPRILEYIQKKITLDQAEAAIRMAKDLGFHTEAAFILGHPFENIQTAYRTIHFASCLNPDIVQLGIMVPYPGTEVAHLAQQGKGGYKVISSNWSDYNKQLGNALELEDLSRADLERLQLVGYLKLFIFNKRFKDFIYFIWNYKKEMISFFKNHFRKNKIHGKSRLGISLMMKMLFARPGNL